MFVNIPTEVGATEPEEIGAPPRLSSSIAGSRTAPMYACVQGLWKATSSFRQQGLKP